MLENLMLVIQITVLVVQILMMYVMIRTYKDHKKLMATHLNHEKFFFFYRRLNTDINEWTLVLEKRIDDKKINGFNNITKETKKMYIQGALNVSRIFPLKDSNAYLIINALEGLILQARYAPDFCDEINQCGHVLKKQFENYFSPEGIQKELKEILIVLKKANDKWPSFQEYKAWKEKEG